MNSYSIAVLGGDLRQAYLASYLQQLGHRVICYQVPSLPRLTYAESLEEGVSGSEIVIGPVPFSKDGLMLSARGDSQIPFSKLLSSLSPSSILAGGMIPSALYELCSEKNIKVYDYMTSEFLTLHNAALTAEGMICELIGNTPFALQDARILITGYGRCGSILAHKLKALGSIVTVCDSAEPALSLAASYGFHVLSREEFLNACHLYDIYVNTAGAMVYTEDILKALPAGSLLFDLSSLPGGIDREEAVRLGHSVFHCLGIPGKTAPKTAGETIGKDILVYAGT